MTARSLLIILHKEIGYGKNKIVAYDGCHDGNDEQ